MKNFGTKSLQRHIAESGDKIVFCEADGRYTRICYTDNKLETIPANLKVIEHLVNEDNFFRSHHSNLVNLNYIVDVNFNTRTIFLKYGYVAEVSVRKVTELKYLRANGKRIPGFDFSRRRICRKKSTQATF